MPDTNDELEFTIDGERVTISFDEDHTDSPNIITDDIPEPEGYNCVHCGDFYRYAKANQTNGTFKCWGCRH